MRIALGNRGGAVVGQLVVALVRPLIARANRELALPPLVVLMRRGAKLGGCEGGGRHGHGEQQEDCGAFHERECTGVNMDNLQLEHVPVT